MTENLRSCAASGWLSLVSFKLLSQFFRHRLKTGYERILHRSVLYSRLRVPSFTYQTPKAPLRRLRGLVPVVGLSAQTAVCLHFVQRNSAPFAPRPGKTLHRSVLYSRLRVPSFTYQTPKAPLRRLRGLVPVVGLSAQTAVCLHFVQRNSAPFAPRPGKTLHRSVLYSRLRVPSFIYQTPKTP